MGGLIETKVAMPIWFDPIANNGTPMAQAFQFALTLAQNWVAEHPASFPPIVINITDGESTDGDPTPIAEKTRRSRSAGRQRVDDESPPLFLTELHQIHFPADSTGLPDKYAEMLFGLSSGLFQAACARQHLNSTTSWGWEATLSCSMHG